MGSDRTYFFHFNFDTKCIENQNFLLSIDYAHNFKQIISIHH